MTHLALFVLLWLVGEDGNLLTLAVLENLSLNSGLCTILACLEALVAAYCQNFIKCDFCISLGIQLFDVENIALSNLVLLTTCYDSCVYSIISFISLATIGVYTRYILLPIICGLIIIPE